MRGNHSDETPPASLQLKLYDVLYDVRIRSTFVILEKYTIPCCPKTCNDETIYGRENHVLGNQWHNDIEVFNSCRSSIHADSYFELNTCAPFY